MATIVTIRPEGQEGVRCEVEILSLHPETGEQMSGRVMVLEAGRDAVLYAHEQESILVREVREGARHEVQARVISSDA